MTSPGNRVARLRYQDLLTTRDGSVPDKDSKLKNVIVEAVNGQPQVIKRQGYRYVMALGNTQGNGIYSFIDASNVEHFYGVSTINLYSISKSITLSNTWVNFDGPDIANVYYFILNDILFAYKTSSLAYYKTSISSAWVSFIPTGIVTLQTEGSMVTMNGRAYALGYGASRTDVYSTADGMSWSKISTGFPGFKNVTAIAYNNKLWTLAMQDNAGNRNNKVYSSSDGVVWTSINGTPAFGNDLQNLSACIFNGKMWLMGGQRTGGMNDSVYYSTDGNTWSVATASSGATATDSGVMVSVGLSMYFFGGKQDDTQAYTSTDGITWSSMGAMNLSFPTYNAAFVPTDPLAFTWQEQILILNQQAGPATAVSAGLYQGTAQSLNLTSTTLGAFVTAGYDMVDFAINYAGTVMMAKSSLAAYAVTISSGSMATITTNFPTTTARGIVYLDAVFYVMDKSGTIYGSAVNDPTTWTALNVINSQVEPDGGVCLQKLNQYVVAFGRYTTEFFFDAGNATGSPLSPVANATILYGCTNANSVAFADGAIYFAAQSKAQGQSYSAGIQIGRLVGLQYERVSTDSVERILNNDGLTTCFSCSMSIFGHTLYLITLPNSLISLVYDTDTKLWHEFTVRTAGGAYSVTALTGAANVDGTTITASATCAGHPFTDGDPVTIAGATPSAYNGTYNITVTSSSAFTYQVPSVPALTTTGTITATGTTESYYPLISSCNYTNAQILQNVVDGSINQIVDTTYTDNTVYIDSTIRTSRFDQDKNQMKFLAWMDLVTDRTDGYAMVRYSDTDYQSWSKYRKVSLSGKRSRLNRQGKFLRRAFEIRITDSIAFRFQGLDLALEEGVE